jgi:hypothetical protein
MLQMLTEEDRNFIVRAFAQRVDKLTELLDATASAGARAALERGIARMGELGAMFAGGELIAESGAAMIVAERNRQRTAEGWTPEHDDTHTHAELARAAACYAAPSPIADADSSLPVWPAGWKRNPSDRIRDLAKAGALCAAEIDRLKREILGNAAP